MTPSCPWKIRILAAVVSFSAWNSAGISQQPWRRHLFHGSCGRGQNFYGTRHEQFCGSITTKWDGTNWIQTRHGSRVENRTIYDRWSRRGSGSLLRAWSGGPNLPGLLVMVGDPNVDSLDPNPSMLVKIVILLLSILHVWWLQSPSWFDIAILLVESTLRVARGFPFHVKHCLWLHSIFSFWQIGKHPDVSCLNSPSWLVPATCI